jgi:hypothetical protein
MEEMCFDIQELFSENSYWYKLLERIAWTLFLLGGEVIFMGMFFSCDWLDEL